ncbi:hypothetical protein LXA43DRAFT_1035104 [Ganoderma leucocontextum]|nr:hypothetical protein LXA43DRAFT_1035104 [Ganoderma leucocontextum]
MSHMTVEREGDVLRRLNSVDSDGFPTLVCHGDVLEQVTIASDWSRSHDLRPRLLLAHLYNPCETVPPHPLDQVVPSRSTLSHRGPRGVFPWTTSKTASN